MNLEGSTIFIVEDDQIFANDLEKTIIELGYKSAGISDNKDEALEKIRILKPSLVIIDITLNEKPEGLDLARIILKETEIPVVFVTAQKDEKVIRKALPDLPYAYLVKPIKESELDLAIKLSISHSKLKTLVNTQKNFYETILDKANLMILFLSKDQRVKYINKKGCELLEGKREEIIGKNWFDSFLPSSIRESIRTLFMNNLKIGAKELEYMENEILTLKGNTRLIAWNNSLWINQEGEIEGFISIGEDITEKREVEENLLLTLFAVERAGDGIVWVDEEGKIKFINKSAALLLEHTSIELFDKMFPPFLLPRTFSNFRKFIEYLKETDILTYEVISWREKTGRSIFRIKANYFLYKKQEYVFFLIEDITKEHLLKEQLTILSMCVDQSPAAVIVTDECGKIEYVNQTFIELTGYTLEEVIGKTPRILKSGYQNEKDYKILWETITSGKVWKGIFQNRKKNGDLFWVKARIFPVIDEKGKIIHFVGEQENITEEKKAQEALEKTLMELSKLNKELDEKVATEVKKNIEKERLMIQQSRLAAMGEMLGNIAHQWRQPLNAVGIIIQSLFFKYKNNELTPESFEENVSKVMELLKHMSRTIDDFRNFFKPDKEKETFSLVSAVERTLSFLKASFEAHNIKWNLNYKKDILVEGYPNEFSQVLVNIFNNAYDVFIERNIENPLVDIRIEESSDKNAILKISDNAGGIPEEIIDRIFDPYFSTKPGGTGIGLYMSRKIIENMNGKLYARNAKNGAEFIIELKIL